MNSLWQDIKFGLRMLAKNPGFTATAVITLALAIGANTAIFSVLDPLLLRKLPVRDPDQLVLVHSAGTLESVDESTFPIYELYRRDAAPFNGVLAYTSNLFEDQIELAGAKKLGRAQLISDNYFSVLGVRPFAGRFFRSPSSETAAAPLEIVLGFDYWRREFRGDSAIIGHSVSLKGETGSFTVVGVTPPEFFGAEVGVVPDFYQPFDPRTNTRDWVKVLARLKPGVSAASAESAIAPLYPEVSKLSNLPEIEIHQAMDHLVLTPAARGRSDLRAQLSLPARILMAVVMGILLISCVNVANLLLARGTARRKEITIRLAMGAGRARLIRQMFTETTLLAFVGAIAGILLARWTSAAIVAALSSRRLPIAIVAGLDARVLAFAAGTLIITIFAVGLVPALIASRTNLAGDVTTRSTVGGKYQSSGTLSKSLVAAQVALAVTILAGAGLLLHSLFNLETFDAGFDRNSVIIATLADSQHERTPADAQNLYLRVMNAVASLPGVDSVAQCSYAPVSGREVGVNVALDGQPPRSGESHAFLASVTPRYFETMGIQLLAGRDFGAQDIGTTSQHVLIINRTMARHYFGDEPPIGKRIRMVEGNRPPFEIVGVAADSVYNDLREQTPDFFYVDRDQSPVGVSLRGTLNLRVSANLSRSIESALTAMIHSTDPNLSLANIQTLREEIDESLHQDRLVAILCAILGALALALTCVGLYGVLSFQVTRRTSEIGIRVALGARPQNILRLVVGQGMRLVLIGLFAGIGGALSAAIMLKSLLFRVGSADAVTIVGVCAALAVSAALACYMPARRAARIDPIEALRSE
jgi:predicted permease